MILSSYERDYKHLTQIFKLNERLLLAIADILKVLEILVENVDINSIARKLILHSESLSFLNNTPNPVSISSSKLVA